MSKENGFIQRRRGIWEHVRDGRLSLQDVAVHEYMSSQADTRSGVWRGSAGALSGELCISTRMGRRFIERLERGGYIRRFPTPGKHVCYPILIHKFQPTNGEHKGEQLDAINSISPTDLRYVPIEHGEQQGEQRGEDVTSQKRIEKRNRRVKQEARAASLTFKESPFWDLISVRRKSMPPEFAELCERMYANKNGESIFEFMGLCLDGWKALGNHKYPPAFCTAKAKFKNQAKPNAPNSSALEELEALPWKK